MQISVVYYIKLLLYPPGGLNPKWANVVFKEGIWFTTTAEYVQKQAFMKVTFAMPNRLKGQGYSGLWGLFDGDLENDMVNFVGLNIVPQASKAKADSVSVFGNSCKQDFMFMFCVQLFFGFCFILFGCYVKKIFS